jgi:uncharacterized protein YggU (UPF0235/DUF167 family)
MARVLVRVRPRAKTTAIYGKSGDVYKLYLSAPPVDYKANDACIRYFAELLGVPRSRIAIISGSTSRTKVLEIEGLTQAAVESRLPK